MARPVPLAPGSLALVLCRLEAARSAEEEPGGRAVFRAFCRANARCFWNARLARAASRLAFVGWLRRAVLLVLAAPACLQVLRDAWRRRALRPPPGFRIRAVGDVFPVEMNPIAQSQFVPLAEVLCCAISDMNAAQLVVTQESLLEHLVKNYPGIAIPSQDILYTSLGTLIKERKIYHTGEGYFIVTPQTYFITNNTPCESKRALMSDEGDLVPTSVTYMVSVESCSELAKENTALVCHCPSCQCFSDPHPKDIADPPTATGVTRKDHKGLRASLVQNQMVSVSEETAICVSSKTLPDTKDKEKGKKFGFGFLWRSISRKEKPKTVHSSFSAQFPPEQWPVRDEGNLDNIPRDVEHEIIKRINPVLTVDNLIKHTVLMQTYEEQKKCNSQGTSTDVLIARRAKYPSKEGIKKRQVRSAKPHRRGHSHKDRHKARSRRTELHPGSIRLEKPPRVPVSQPAPRTKSLQGEVQALLGEHSAVLGSHLIYKKQISNPFQGLSLRGSPVSKGYSIHKASDLKPSQVELKDKPFQRSRSSEPSRVFGGETQEPYAGQCHDKLDTESIYVTSSTVLPVSDDLRDGCLSYPPCSVLQPDSQCCPFGESKLRCDQRYNEESKVMTKALRKSHSHLDTPVETKETQENLPSHGSSSSDPASSAGRLVDNTIYQFQNLGLLDYPVGKKHLRPQEAQDRDSEELIRKALVPEAEVVSRENEGFCDDGQALYQEKVEEDDGACSSLYLEEDDFSENDDLCHMLPGHTPYSLAGGSRWKHLEKPKVTEGSPTECNSQMERFEAQMLKRSHCYRPTDLLLDPGEGQSPNLPTESCGLNAGEAQLGFSYEEPSVAVCVQASAPAQGSLLGSSTARKSSLEVKILQEPVGTGQRPASWSQSPPRNQDARKHFTAKLERFNTSHRPVLAWEARHEHGHLEGAEYHSVAGDSGIDSPRTQSLASNNSVILDGLKRRQNFLQSFEGTKNSQTLTSESLLQLTPVINV